MSRFVFVSFAFLGWAFYELSGGADFKPPERPIALTKSTLTESGGEPRGQADLRLANIPATAPRAVPEVATVQTNIVTAAATRPRSETDSEPAATRLNLRLGNSLDLFPATTGIEGLRLASLEQGTAGLSQTTVTDETPEAEPVAIAAEPVPDLREITGTRVNMRQGPGTNYPILIRLSIGQEVEVLDDSGTGWLRLRALPDRTMGWIAASLVSKKRP